eukprot:CAMPEP_0178440476 /NCGR_PEP_ID=MMETSP0689_2-20121128/36814_1 /TAXON_ID=160604 /ORGANISM="Amphidinium massartii, Strain CS-259" /LENGTH=445 /DNA_ID=CAMNT_0020063283 /DNA_START=52 /DNA_END=1385 /DNA_ORIENTATION=+
MPPRPASGDDAFVANYNALQQPGLVNGAAAVSQAASSQNGARQAVEPSKNGLAQAEVVKSSMMATIINVTKGIIGAGMLTLPLAIHESSVIPGLLLLTFSAGISAFSFALLGYGCAATGAESFHELWTATMGKSSAWAVQLSIMCDNCFTLWAYSTLVADFVGKAMVDLLPSFSLAHSRFFILAIVGTAIFAPLSYQQTLDALKYTSGLGLCAIAYSCICLFTEYVESGEGTRHFTGNYCAVKFLIFKSSVLFAFSFGCHYSVPKVYSELAQRSERRIGLVAVGAFTASLLIYTAFAMLGYGRFGSHVAGNVLVNFHEGNVAVLLMWVAMAASVITSYPMIFFSLKENLYGLLDVAEKDASVQLRLGIVIVGVSGSCLLGAAVEDASIVMGICGALVSSAVQFCFPAMIFLSLPSRGLKGHKASSCWLRSLSKALFVVGVFTALT